MNRTVIMIKTDDRGIAELFSNALPGSKLEKCKARRNHADPNEEHDDIMSVPSAGKRISEGLCEIAGLIRRARTEIADGNVNAAYVTLGRAGGAVERAVTRFGGHREHSPSVR